MTSSFRLTDSENRPGQHVLAALVATWLVLELMVMLPSQIKRSGNDLRLWAISIGAIGLYAAAGIGNVWYLVKQANREKKGSYFAAALSVLLIFVAGITLLVKPLIQELMTLWFKANS